MVTCKPVIDCGASPVLKPVLPHLQSEGCLRRAASGPPGFLNLSKEKQRKAEATGFNEEGVTSFRVFEAGSQSRLGSPNNWPAPKAASASKPRKKRHTGGLCGGDQRSLLIGRGRGQWGRSRRVGAAQRDAVFF